MVSNWPRGWPSWRSGKNVSTEFPRMVQVACDRAEERGMVEAETYGP